MSKTEFLNNMISTRNNELKEFFALNYGMPSYDETLKLASMKNLYNLTIRDKQHYINNFDLLKKVTSDNENEKNKISVSERIDYNLTLIKLLEMFENKMQEYSLFVSVINDTNNSASIISSGNLIPILEAFNKVKVDEYKKYAPLFFNKVFINHTCNHITKDYKSFIQRVRNKLDYSINMYSDNIDSYNDENKKDLIKLIVNDLDNYLDLKKKVR